MTLEELLIATELEDLKDAQGKNVLPKPHDDEDQPDWLKTNFEEIKKDGEDPLKRAAKAVTSAMMQEPQQLTSQNFGSELPAG